MLQQMLTVFAVMGLMIGLLQWLRRRGVAHLRTGLVRRKAGRRLELLERLPLTPQHSLHIVRMDGRSLLIGVSPSGCALLENLKGAAGAGESA
jgi:flagellar biogenesis protein FliO